MATLKQGDRGMDVRRLQILLNSSLVPSPSLKADGDFGARTLDAVRRFQQLRGLAADGVVGTRTWFALGQMGTSTAPSEPTATLQPWLDIAKAELGIHEDALPGQHSQ